MVLGEEKKQQEEFLEKVRREEEENRAKLLAEKTNFPYLNLSVIPIESDALKLISREKTEEAKAAVISLKVKTLRLVVLNPNSKETKALINELRESGYLVNIFVVSPISFKRALSHYPRLREAKEITGRVEISKEDFIRFQKEIVDLEDFKKIAERLFESKATEIVEAALASALILKISDIHFEPEKDSIRLRFRRDGVLEDIIFMPANMYNLVLNRIKLLSRVKLNIHEKAQDGRFTIASGKNEIEIRTSVLPGAYGENIVMRVLDPSTILINLKDLGIREDDLEIIDKQLSAPTGMILTTGPTGSGKTTTLYAFIKKILSSETKIITIEDPIEYHIKGVSQTQVAPDKGYTFENGLSSIVRQDPDVILVGEIRDFETAEIAMHAALTGHLVFSTLHTNNAVGAIPRLLDLGIKPSIIAPAINMLMAQRLLRRVCPKCAVKQPITKAELSKFKEILRGLPPRVKKIEFNDKIFISEAKGCNECHNGYLGRVAVMELFEITDDIERLILGSPTESQLIEAAKKTGMVSMIQDALIKILQGITTIEEAERILGSFI